VGSVEPRKGQRELLRALLPEIAQSNTLVNVFIIGSIEDRHYYQLCLSEVSQCNIYVRFVGYRRNLSEWYRRMDVLAHPAIREGLGRAVVEAQSFGVPVVALDIPGVRDAVCHSFSAVLCSSHQHMALELVSLLRDSDRRIQMGEHGIEYTKRFDVYKVTKDLEDVYRALTASA
jgi:glycosyltransferase involved in cell wall biosynthesis